MTLDGLMDSAWPMFCHDTYHTGRSPYSTANVTNLEKWRYYTPGWVQGGAVIDIDGIIYFGNHGLYLYALYPNGTLKWKCDIGCWIETPCAIAEDGTIYAPTSNPWDGLYAVNPNGTKKWRFGCGKILSSPAIDNDGIIYFGTDDGSKDKGSIYALYPNKTIKWRFRPDDLVLSSPVIGDDGTIYCGSHDKYLYAIYPNGTLRWKFKTSNWIRASPCIGDNGLVFCTSISGDIYALYPNNGTLKWKAGGGSGTHLTTGPDGTVYTGWDKLRAYYCNNGTVKWLYDPGERVVIEGACPVTSVEGFIYFGTRILETAGGHIICLNSDGIEQWRKIIADEWVDGAPCIGPDGTVYIGSSWVYNSYLHAFGPVESNSPPEKPSIIGETNGKVGNNYEYMFRAVDPDNNPISYYIEWGDGMMEDWCREYASNEKHYVTHKYTVEGNFTIKAKVRDVLGEESGWGTFNVTMIKKSKDISSSLFLRFLERYPLLSRLLNLIK